MELQTHQQRVVTEHDELQQKYYKLIDFICSEKFTTVPAPEQERLYSQSDIMHAYINVLDRRIAAFTSLTVV